MKKIITLLTVMIFSLALLAQQIPQGMKYQAVARNLKGEILSDEQIVLRISLTSQQNNTAVTHYSEIHNVKTNELGLFNLVIGEGAGNKSAFKNVPWSSQNIWMEVAIADNLKGSFTIISSSKLLAVPYAFHAETANSISTNNTGVANRDAGPTPSSPWTTKGNSGVMPSDYLGTSDDKSLIIKTNGLERMNVLSTGDVNVKGNVNLNTTSGATVNNGNFTVANVKATDLSGTLTVGKATNLNDVLNVNNTKATNLTGSLTVEKLVALNDVTESNTKDDGALVVEGGVGIEKNLNVGGALNVTGLATLKNLAVDGVTGKSIDITDNSTGYLATFENTNNGNGDGIKITLGRRHALHPSQGTSAFTLPSFSQNPFANTTTAFQNYFNNLINTKGSFSADDLLEDAGTGLLSDMENVAQLLASKLVDITNIVINKVNDGIGKVNTALSLPYNLATPINSALKLPFDLTKPINDGLGLPIKFGPLTTPAVNLPALNTPEVDLVIVTVPSLHVSDAKQLLAPQTLIGQFTAMPVLPKVEIPKIPDLILPAIPNIPTITPINPGPLGNLSIDFTFPWDAVNDPLTNDNEFIGFYDKNGTKAGAIRGQSIGEWFTNYFDVPWFITTAESFLARVDEDAGTVGPFSFVKLAAKSLSTTIQFGYDFSNMGIEYSSGNGDYAEWLERADPKEKISYGDIVAVKGGKITKDLTGAEQIMAVSHKPIVLGNVPEKGKLPMGNNIAFMGQIPVKIMGPVQAGDYIVAKSEISGYGVAVNPENMKVEDYKLAVGRSWTTNESKGPKMVNTVVGVHNNGFLQIIKELQQKADSNDERLKAIEMKLNISNSTEKEKAKKPFK